MNSLTDPLDSRFAKNINKTSDSPENIFWLANKMVYIHIPEALTEEEQMLMAKYAKLKKKASFYLF